MGEMIRVLIIEDSKGDGELLIRELIKGGYDPQILVVDTAEKMAGALDRQTWDIVLSDDSMPHFNGAQALMLWC